MSDDLTVTANDVNESTTLATKLAEAKIADGAPVADQPAASPQLSHLEKARAAAKANALAKHDVTKCLCPFCRGERKRQNIPNPPRVAKVTTEPAVKAAPKPATPATIPDATSAVVHAKEDCPCVECSEWRTNRARSAANARYAKEALESYPWDTAPLPEAEQRLSDMRKDIERGARALSSRYSTANDKYVKCAHCNSDIINGRWVMQKTKKDEATGLFKNIFFCTAGCVNMYGSNSNQHGPSTGEPTGLHPEHARNKAAVMAANKGTN
jgi:hypothetical protein